MEHAWNEILAFCIASAIGCMDEPPVYGPLRLIDVLERLIRYGAAQDFGAGGALLPLADYIQEHKLECMHDEPGFRKSLLEIAQRLMDTMGL